MTQSKLSFEDLLARLCERQAELPAEVQEAVQMWLEYKQERGESYTLAGFDRLLSGIRNKVKSTSADYVVRGITRSVISGWQGIYY